MTPEEQRAYDRARYQRNPEKFRAEARARYWAKRDENRERQRARREADPRRYLLNNARERSRLNGLEFDLRVEDIFVPALCPVLGIPIIRGQTKKTDNSPSLDRIDNTRGYVRGNVAVISDRANRIKNYGTADEHRRIADWMDANVS